MHSKNDNKQEIIHNCGAETGQLWLHCKQKYGGNRTGYNIQSKRLCNRVGPSGLYASMREKLRVPFSQPTSDLHYSNERSMILPVQSFEPSSLLELVQRDCHSASAHGYHPDRVPCLVHVLSSRFLSSSARGHYHAHGLCPFLSALVMLA